MPKVHVTYEFEDEEAMRAHFAGATSAAPVRAAALMTGTPTAPTPAADDGTLTATTEFVQSRMQVDGDGMPYDPDLHSSPASLKDDGTWRVKRGKAREEAEARAAFKAAGGDEEPPANLPSEPAAVAPTLPGADALPEPMAPPVSFEKLAQKLSGLLQTGKLSRERMSALYAQHGGTDPANTLAADETARAALYADLVQIEPDL